MKLGGWIRLNKVKGDRMVRNGIKSDYMVQV